MNRKKSTSEDEIILVNENADPIERSSAAKKLLSDGYGEIVIPVLEKWFDSPEFALREDAVSLLLASLGHEKHLNKGILMLHSDKSWSVRSDAARGIGAFCVDFFEGEKYEEQIIKELIVALIKDDEEFVQQECYKWLKIIINKEKQRFGDEKDSFNLQTDVDWNLLQPYLSKYGLQRPI
jgi:hypothetical protein